MAANLLIESGQGLVTLTMNRPEKRNPLSAEMMKEMIAALREIGAQREVRAVILAGRGAAFSAGHDLAELRGREISFYREIFDLCSELMTTIQRIPQPIVASVGGVATAAGCQLVATCDLAIAAASARFATPGVKIGLFCSTPMVALSRAIGRKHSMEMLLSGRMIDAETAERWGLVNHVVPDAELADATRRLALEIADASPLTIAIGKQAFYTQIDLDQAKAYEYTKEVMSLNAMAADAQEGIGAFLDKRQPTWSGR
ncbi:MAG TPA: enoyl-CoA hydratase [Candidatus Binataceae bacterium]|nr:enoyl-CoA hydratase [Candidatus Binataceae bacterium]HTY57034.1 enoyl-CoA hydratase [Candidatus Binataceae bacterium]